MKALTLILCILALLGSAASGYFYWQIGETKTQLQKELAAEQTKATELQNNLTQTTTSLEQKQAQLAETDAALGDAKRSLTAAEARNVQVSREVETLKKTIATKEEQERKLSADLDALRRELVQTRLAAQVGSPEELEKAKQTIASLESRIAEMQNNTGGTGSAATGSASAPGKPAAPSERAANARVVQVGSRNAFVVLDLGSGDNITAGHKFAITRDGNTIAEAVVSEVKETFAIAQVVPSSIKTTLKSGDTASYQE